MVYTIHKKSKTGLEVSLLNHRYATKQEAIAALDEIERYHQPDCQSHWRASDGMQYTVIQNSATTFYNIKEWPDKVKPNKAGG